MTSLDDLLDHDDGRPDRTPGVRAVRWTLAAVLAAAMLAGGLVLALHLFGIALSYLKAFGGFLTLIALHRAVKALEMAPPGRLGGRPEHPTDHAGPDGLALAAGRWQSQLNWSRAGPNPSKKSAAPIVAELADERLRRHHGITRHSNPDRARELLGEKLWSYLADPAARTPSSRDLATMLTQVEKL